MSLKPIVMDLETSGLDIEKSGIWQIGAIDLNTMEEFFEEGRIDDEDIIDEAALIVIGKTEEELRDKNKQSQKELLEKFFKWIDEKAKSKIFLCQNPQFDVGFLDLRTRRYRLKKPYNFRAFDLHTIAQLIYQKINGEFLFKIKGSDMNLGRIIEFVGMKDERIKMRNSEVAEEGKPHNALEDSKLTAECFSRLVYGKKLFGGYDKFEIPEVLKKWILKKRLIVSHLSQ